MALWYPGERNKVPSCGRFPRLGEVATAQALSLAGTDFLPKNNLRRLSENLMSGELTEKLNERLWNEPDEEELWYHWASRETVLSAGKKILTENSEFYEQLAEYDRLRVE
jgi:hypothetical protein